MREQLDATKKRSPSTELNTPWLNHDEAARYVKRSPSSLRFLCRDGRGPPRKKIGGLYVYKTDWLDEWVESFDEQ